jgi:hypothetical protein
MAFLSDKQEYCLESGQLELELHVARFFKKFENDVWKFQNIPDKFFWDR